MRIFGVILAGGQGRRMGGTDKALLQLSGQSLIHRAVDRLEPQVERLAISANGDAGRFSNFGLTVLHDDVSVGPLSGILSALNWAATLGATAVVSAPVDCPFLPPDLVPRLGLAAESSPSGTALAASGGVLHPTFGLWPTALRAPLAQFLTSGAKARVKDFASDHHAAIADFPDDAAFANLNTPEDLARASTLLGETG